MSEQRAFQQMVSTNRLTTKLTAPIKAMIEQFFAEQGIHTRTLYRTDPARFGNAFGGNCPHNFLPRSIEANHITVYMEFKDADIHLDNLIRIIAYPDVEAPNLPCHPKPHNGYEKVILEKLPAKYIFQDWDDLKANYRRIFAR